MSKNFEFQTIFPPEGRSSVLEVSLSGEDFAHVSKADDGKLIFKFYDNGSIALSEDDLAKIKKVAEDAVTLADPDLFGDV